MTSWSFGYGGCWARWVSGLGSGSMLSDAKATVD